MSDFIPVIFAAVASIGLVAADPLDVLHDKNMSFRHVHSAGATHTYCVEGNMITVVALTGAAVDQGERCK